MLTKKTLMRAVVASLAATISLAAQPLRAQDAGALLDLLVKKKLITDQEAEEVRGELVKESAQTSTGKWKLSTPLNELELYGDVRLRYQYNGGRSDNNPVEAPRSGGGGYPRLREDRGRAC